MYDNSFNEKSFILNKIAVIKSINIFIATINSTKSFQLIANLPIIKIFHKHKAS